MNRLRSHKFKLNTSADNDNDAATMVTSPNGLLEKLGKQYTTFSRKIRRRSPRNRSSKSPQPIATGSYNMNGAHSEDHRLEIGAPVLISSTTLDTDRFDVSEERLKMIGGGIAATANSPIFKITALQSNGQVVSENRASSSSTASSETEVYVDARSSTPIQDSQENIAATNHQETDVKEFNDNRKDSTLSLDENDTDLQSENTTNADYTYTMNTNNNSQLKTNLHRSELRISLQKPSEELPLTTVATNAENPTDNNIDEDISENNIKLNHVNFLQQTHTIIHVSTQDDHQNNEVPAIEIETVKELSSSSSPPPPLQPISTLLNSSYPPMKSNSELETPFYFEEKKSIFGIQKKMFQSADNLNQRKSKRHNILFNSSNCINGQYPSSLTNGHVLGFISPLGFGSKNSIISQSSEDDYNLKSVSCQSLNPQTLFVSIDELNKLTRKINESDEFNQAIDLEYCMHRDQLKPSERRITLLKNKNSSNLVKLTHNTERLKKSWSEMKHWLGEEGARIRYVVQKQPLVKRVGTEISLNTNKINNHSEKQTNHSADTNHPNHINITNLTTVPINTISDNFDAIPRVNCEKAVVTPDDGNDMNLSPDEEFLYPFTKREGQNGFDELRRYIKQSGDFGKELTLIMQERIDTEQMYSKSLSKMANKLNKACRELPGSMAEAWRSVAAEMEGRSEVHRQLSASFHEEIVKPLKAIVEAHHKSRKTVESSVDKAARVLAEWRASEAKGKKMSHAAARENEKLQDAMLDVRIQKSPSIGLLQQSNNKVVAEKEIRSAEKDCAKLDNKRKKAEEAVKKADVEYYTLCVRAERARVDWEMAVLRGSTLLQSVENQRLLNMKNFLSNYSRLTASINPLLDGLVQRLQPPIDACNVHKDMHIIKNIRQSSENSSEQLLPDFYCEHTTLAMNRERRKHSLIKLLQLIKTDLERERRSRNGLKNLSQTLVNNPEHHNITDKLYHIRSMLTYLEGARYKLHAVLLELDHKPRSNHPLAPHIQVTRDRTGLQQSVLKVPLWLKNNEKIENNCNSVGDCSDYEDNDSSIKLSPVSLTGPGNNAIYANGSVIESTVPNLKTENLLKRFNRSRSNIEDYSGHICALRSNNSSTSTNISNTSPNKVGKANTLTNGTTMTLCNDVYTDRGQADGGSNQQDSDFDEFSSQDGDETDDKTEQRKHSRISGHHVSNQLISVGSLPLVNGKISMSNNFYQNTAEVIQQNGESCSNGFIKNITHNGKLPNTGIVDPTAQATVLSRCKALYNYAPKLYDELELRPGDIIEVHAKQEDGWWLGALRDQIGIFPATYVEEIA